LAGVFIPLEDVLTAEAYRSARQLVVKQEYDYSGDLDLQVGRVEELFRVYLYYFPRYFRPIVKVIDLKVLIHDFGMASIDQAYCPFYRTDLNC
jgi:hypothetical protein